MQAAGKVVEQRGEIALLGDGLAYFEQGFELMPGVLKGGRERHFRRGDDGIRHRRQDNTRVGGGSTTGVEKKSKSVGCELGTTRDRRKKCGCYCQLIIAMTSFVATAKIGRNTSKDVRFTRSDI